MLRIVGSGRDMVGKDYCTDRGESRVVVATIKVPEPKK